MKLAPSSSHHARILVAEDDWLITDVLCLILTLQGYQARAAYSAEEALEVCREFQPHAAILEAWFWTGMNGVDLAKHFTLDHPECKLLLWTAWQSIVPRILQEAKEEGFDFTVWAKPLHPNDVLAKLADLLIPGEAFHA